MDRLFTFIGLYEELYLINILSLSYPDTVSLTSADDHFIITNGSTTSSFQIIPLFFVVKFLLSADNPDFSNKVVLEYVLSHLKLSSPLQLTISDIDQINTFYEFCSVHYLSNYVLTQLKMSDCITVFNITNISKLHI